MLKARTDIIAVFPLVSNCGGRESLRVLMMNCANERSGLLERMFAIAVRDGDDLFLWVRLRRAARNDIYYVLPTGREDDAEWKEWDPHGSWHQDGSLHHKSFNRKMLPAESRQKPNVEFKGTHNLITRGIASDEPRALGVAMRPT